jgi:tRNA-specific 2-thiouridylase
MTRGRVFVAMSGGVDSSVAAALLLEQGYEVLGVTMRLWSMDGEEEWISSRSWFSVEAVDDARRVCQGLGVPHYFLNFEREFQEHVVDYFIDEYRNGRTPNPCLACNRWIKFHFFRRKALAIGADYIATGHYARIEERDGSFHLLKGVDETKDQSYFLYTLNQAELAHLLLPVGGHTKAEVREIAARLGLTVADKPDSQELCFVPDRDTSGFIAERVPSETGPIRDGTGRVLGSHKGIAHYTVGQRHGLDLALGQPVYVRHIEAASNSLVVGAKDELFSDSLIARDVSFVSGDMPQLPMEVTAKIRYRSKPASARLNTVCEGMELHFQEPQRAITPGQAVVFYRGEEVLGGGTIHEVPETGKVV